MTRISALAEAIGSTVRDATENGWPVKYAATVEETAPPTARGLAVRRDLQARTERAQEAA